MRRSKMKKAGGIIALIGGIFGVFAALFTIFVGATAGAFNADGANSVDMLGWTGLGFSFAVIVLAAICMNAETKKPGVKLIIASILGILFGGTLVAIFMVLPLIGGVLALTDSNKSSKNKVEQSSSYSNDASSNEQTSQSEIKPTT